MLLNEARLVSYFKIYTEMNHWIIAYFKIWSWMSILSYRMERWAIKWTSDNTVFKNVIWIDASFFIVSADIVKNEASVWASSKKNQPSAGGLHPSFFEKRRRRAEVALIEGKMCRRRVATVLPDGQKDCLHNATRFAQFWKRSTFAAASEKSMMPDSLAQQVEHIPFKDGVLGSSPRRITCFCKM